MRTISLLVRTSIALGLLHMSHSIFSRQTLTATELMKRINIRCLAAKKTAQLALEKSPSSFLRETVQHLLESLEQANEYLQDNWAEERSDRSSELLEAEKFIFSYEYNEKLSFDLNFVSHQLKECDEMLNLLHQATHFQKTAIKDMALRNMPIFTRYQLQLNIFKADFYKVNEYRIREYAYQIWEQEGRPEGEDKRHWMMATELLRRSMPADLQLAFEQKRSLVESFSTTPASNISNKYH